MATSLPGAPFDPHTQIRSWHTWTGYDLTQALGSNVFSFSLVRVCGIEVHSPSPLKVQAWYEQRSSPLLSTLPSERGTPRWGQASSNTFHFSLSCQRTTLLPRNINAWALLRSVNPSMARGYHCLLQSNCLIDEEEDLSSGASEVSCCGEVATYRGREAEVEV